MVDAIRDASLDDFVARFFRAFDNRNGRIPTLEEISALFIENAVILQHARGEVVIMTVTEFAAPRVALLTSGRLEEFSEWETSNATEVYSRFAVRTSRYSKSGTLDQGPYEGSGTKLLQLVSADGQWKIVSLCWYDEGV